MNETRDKLEVYFESNAKRNANTMNLLITERNHKIGNRIRTEADAKADVLANANSEIQIFRESTKFRNSTISF